MSQSLPGTIYEIADELRVLANQGLYFADNEYHKDRYERVLSASARLIAALEERAPEEVLTQYHGDLLHLSPLAGAEAAVFRDAKLLLIQRRDNALWAVPGGLAEVGETLAEAAVRELWEEAGVRGKAVHLMGFFDSRLWQSRTRVQLYHAVFQIQCEDVPAPGSEALDVGFFPEESLPPLSWGHLERVPVLFKLYRAEIQSPFFDR